MCLAGWLTVSHGGQNLVCGTGFQPVKTRPEWPCHEESVYASIFVEAGHN